MSAVKVLFLFALWLVASSVTTCVVSLLIWTFAGVLGNHPLTFDSYLECMHEWLPVCAIGMLLIIVINSRQL